MQYKKKIYSTSDEKATTTTTPKRIVSEMAQHEVDQIQRK